MALFGLPCSNSFPSSAPWVTHLAGALPGHVTESEQGDLKTLVAFKVCKTKPGERDFEARSPRAFREDSR